MSPEELGSDALKPPPRDRARLAERLLESRENLTDEENESADVLREARAKLKRTEISFNRPAERELFVWPWSDYA